MNVRAKFVCLSVKKYESNVWDKDHKISSPAGFLYSYEFQVVYGNSPENNVFFGSTPVGSLTMSAVREDLFVPGESYYLDFTPEAVGV